MVVSVHGCLVGYTIKLSAIDADRHGVMEWQDKWWQECDYGHDNDCLISARTQEKHCGESETSTGYCILITTMGSNWHSQSRETANGREQINVRFYFMCHDQILTL